MQQSDKSDKTALGMIKQYFLDFGVLRDNPKEFWAVQLINFLDSVAYFSIIAVVTLYLTDTIGWNDVHAGYIVTGFTSFVTISLFFSGFFTDALGIKKSIVLAMTVQLISRAGCLVCGLMPDLPGRQWLVVFFLMLFSPGLAMTLTVFQSANKRFSSRRSRGASFNIWYLIMNLAAVGGGLLISLVRQQLQIDVSWIFAFGVVWAVLSILSGLLLIQRLEQVRLDDEGEEGEKKEEVAQADQAGALQRAWQVAAEAGQRFKTLMGQSAFWRFLVLMVSLLGVRAVFVYMYLLMPKYWVRVIGPEVQMGLLQTINPILIVSGLILVIPIANKFNVFKMLVFGATISSFALLFLVLPYQTWAPLTFVLPDAWFSTDMAAQYFMMSLLMLALLSVGEVFWSPKLNEYTAAIAPEGQEGSYLGMSMMPWFFAKLTVSALSGHMLTRWCPPSRSVELPGSGAIEALTGGDVQASWVLLPEMSERIASGTLSFWERPEAMWLLLFIWAFSGPVLAMVFKGWLTEGADLDPTPREEEAAA